LSEALFSNMVCEHYGANANRSSMSFTINQSVIEYIEGISNHQQKAGLLDCSMLSDSVVVYYISNHADLAQNIKL
jgi:hypothetical protein